MSGYNCNMIMSGYGKSDLDNERSKESRSDSKDCVWRSNCHGSGGDDWGKRTASLPAEEFFQIERHTPAIAEQLITEVKTLDAVRHNKSGWLREKGCITNKSYERISMQP